MRFRPALVATGAVVLAAALATTGMPTAVAGQYPPPPSAPPLTDTLKRELAAAKVDAKLRTKLGARYSGSWLDDDGRLHVRTTSVLGVVAIKALGAEPVLAIGRKDPARAQKLLDRAAKLAPATITGWYVDEPAGEVVVQTTTPAAAERFVAKANLPAGLVRIEKVAEQPRTMADLLGGQLLYGTPGGAKCSIGFSARNATANFVLTAGHCTRATNSWLGRDNTPLGVSVAKNYPTDDFGSIQVTGAGWTPTANVIANGQLISMQGSVESPVGSSVCKVGATTGRRCGTIQARNATITYSNGDRVAGLTRTNVCSQSGDSGGAYYAGRQAQGMLSGGSGNCTAGGTTYFQPVNEALTRLGLTLVTAP